MSVRQNTKSARPRSSYRKDDETVRTSYSQRSRSGRNAESLNRQGYRQSRTAQQRRQHYQQARSQRQSSRKFISKRALLISLAIEIVFVGALVLRFSDSAVIIEKALFGCVLLWLSNTDILWRKIPNASIISAALIRMLYVALALYSGSEHVGIIWNSLVGAVLIGLFAFAISYMTERYSGRAGLGGGDVKLLAIAGLYFGPEGGFLILFLACVTALAGYALHHTDDKTFPFGPAISLACAIVALI